MGDVNNENSPGVSAIAGLLLGSCCILLLVDLVILAFGDLCVLRGDVAVDVDGVLEGVGVLSDSSESFTSWDFPWHILKTMGGFVSFLFVLLALELRTVCKIN